MKVKLAAMESKKKAKVTSGESDDDSDPADGLKGRKKN